MKKACVFIVIAVIFTSVGFLLGRTQKSFETINKLSREVGIDPAERQESIAKIEELLQQDDFPTAELYFVNAVHRYPGNWDILSQYYDTIVRHSQQLQQAGDYENAQDVLSRLEGFMQTQALYISMTNIEELEAVFDEIHEHRQQLTEAEIKASVHTSLETVKQLQEYDTATASIGELTERLAALEDIFFALDAIETETFLDEQTMSDVAEAVIVLEHEISNVEQQISLKEAEANTQLLTKQARDFIQRAQQETVPPELILYYLTSAESMISQAVLLSSNIQHMTPVIIDVVSSLEDAKIQIADQQSQVVWEDITQTFERIKTTEYALLEKQSRDLFELRTTLISRSNDLSSPRYVEQDRELVNDIDRRIAEIQHQQVDRYNQWAMNRISVFYADYQEELGAGTNEQRIYEAMILYLGTIDTRYLSTAVQVVYSEVFSRFYSELKKEQKIPVSSNITLKAKKLLSDF
jgi:hypothetical protein